MSNGDRRPSALSFSQAQGYEELPRRLEVGALPESARVHIWNEFYAHMAKRYRNRLDKDWEKILRETHLWHDNRPLNEWDGRFEDACDLVQSRIFGEQFNRVFDFVQFVMRRTECPKSFVESMSRVFELCGLAYTITTEGVPTIIPAVTEAEGAAIVGSLNELRSAELGGSVTHLEKSAHFLNEEDWAGSVRESIHAVESVARQVVPENADTLSQALNSSSWGATLHPHFVEALKKLYWYASDEQGVRHALLEREEASVGKDEAIFMLGACASFASYLWRKHKASGPVAGRTTGKGSPNDESFASVRPD